MYAGCNGATYVYACCIVSRVPVCGKIQFLAMRTAKGDFMSAQGNGKGLLSKFALGEANIAITYAP